MSSSLLQGSQDRSTELHTRGIEQVQDIHKADHGVRDHEGIRIVDGWPHCAATPLDLADIERPQCFEVAPLKKRATAEVKLNFECNTEDLAKFDAKIAEHRKYAFECHIKNPSDKDPRDTRWKFPAEAGKMKCALCPLSDAPEYDDKPVVENPGPADTAPKCRRPGTINIPGLALSKLRQLEFWGSPEWIQSYLRRNHIEGIFGNLRNQSTQTIKRGFCRVMGMVKTSLMLSFEVVAAKIRIVRHWFKSNDLTTDPPCQPVPQDYGFEELDANAQICLAERFLFYDPPGDLAA
jgi:hypothetical protein